MAYTAIADLIDRAEELVDGRTGFIELIEKIERTIAADPELKFEPTCMSLGNLYRVQFDGRTDETLKKIMIRDAECFRKHETKGGLIFCLTKQSQ